MIFLKSGIILLVVMVNCCHLVPVIGCMFIFVSIARKMERLFPVFVLSLMAVKLIVL